MFVYADSLGHCVEVGRWYEKPEKDPPAHSTKKSKSKHVGSKDSPRLAPIMPRFTYNAKAYLQRQDDQKSAPDGFEFKAEFPYWVILRGCARKIQRRANTKGGGGGLCVFWNFLVCLSSATTPKGAK